MTPSICDCCVASNYGIIRSIGAVRGFHNFLFSELVADRFPNLSRITCTVNYRGSQFEQVCTMDPLTGLVSQTNTYTGDRTVFRDIATWSVNASSTKTTRSETWASELGTATVEYVGVSFDLQSLITEARTLCLSTAYPQTSPSNSFVSTTVYSRGAVSEGGTSSRIAIPFSFSPLKATLAGIIFWDRAGLVPTPFERGSFIYGGRLIGDYVAQGYRMPFILNNPCYIEVRKTQAQISLPYRRDGYEPIDSFLGCTDYIPGVYEFQPAFGPSDSMSVVTANNHPQYILCGNPFT